jgi:hypothetical protein
VALDDLFGGNLPPAPVPQSSRIVAAAPTACAPQPTPSSSTPGVCPIHGIPLSKRARKCKRCVTNAWYHAKQLKKKGEKPKCKTCGALIRRDNQTGLCRVCRAKKAPPEPPATAQAPKPGRGVPQPTAAHLCEKCHRRPTKPNCVWCPECAEAA